MANKLVEKREELAAKQAQWHEIFSTYPDLDMPADVAADLKARNDEMSDLGKEVERLVSLEGMAAKNAERGEWLNRPAGGIVHAGGGNGAPPARSEPPPDAKSIVAQFLDSDAFTGYRKGMSRGPEVEVRAPEGVGLKTLLTETGFAPQAIRTPRIVEGALRRPMVEDLLPQGTTDQISIVFQEETTTTNAAAMVAEGAAKPESALAFTERQAPVRKAATVLPITDELLADVPAMRSYVEARLRLFLELATETQLISGDGNAPNITGLLNATNLQTQAKGADPTPDAIYKAMVKIQTVAFVNPSGVIFNPLDWQDVRLLRTADGIYIWGQPMDPGPERIWGLPVVVTTAMTQNTALVGAFDSCTQMFNKGGVSFAISDQNEDFFIKNKLMLRVERRFALAIYRGAGLCQVTGV